MGPIERELRLCKPGSGILGLSKDAFRVAVEAADNLDMTDDFLCVQGVDGDVLSEAIEAAEALEW